MQNHCFEPGFRWDVPPDSTIVYSDFSLFFPSKRPINPDSAEGAASGGSCRCLAPVGWRRAVGAEGSGRRRSLALRKSSEEKPHIAAPGER